MIKNDGVKVIDVTIKTRCDASSSSPIMLHEAEGKGKQVEKNAISNGK